MVVISKKTVTSVLLYAVQSFVLVLIFLAIGKVLASPELYTWGVTALITKVILVPYIIYRSFDKFDSSPVEGTIIQPKLVVAITTVIVILSYFVVNSIHLNVIDENHLKPALTVSLGHFMIGLTCIITQRNILKQVFGYCIMENGAHLTLALLANKAPHLVEIGITTDAIFAVIIMTYVVRRIYESVHTLDANDLTTLKG
jgi:hydrogenase-4 component E